MSKLIHNLVSKMKKLLLYIEEALIKKTISREDAILLIGWIDIAINGTDSMHYKEFHHLIESCYDILKFRKTLGASEIFDFEDILSRCIKLKNKGGAELTITRKEAHALSWLGKYVHDKSTTWTEDCQKLWNISLKLN